MEFKWLACAWFTYCAISGGVIGLCSESYGHFVLGILAVAIFNMVLSWFVFGSYAAN